MDARTNFNSIKVQLEPDAIVIQHGGYRHFNSIKVQLELSEQKSYHSNRLFQFHKGTIRTLILISLFLKFQDFNSIKVQLEHKICNDYYRNEKISIP